MNPDEPTKFIICEVDKYELVLLKKYGGTWRYRLRAGEGNPETLEKLRSNIKSEEGIGVAEFGRVDGKLRLSRLWL